MKTIEGSLIFIGENKNTGALEISKAFDISTDEAIEILYEAIRALEENRPPID
ncbi:hypothetical protein GCM10023310_68920 [Paenibacillus vulneris]|uniref:Uncharacterized protein n=1 Tax=Paenibacillus vulneris TaxID=1133364 RepID=A0ABW3UGK8_9BACL